MARPDRPPGRERDGGPTAEAGPPPPCRNPAARSDAGVIHRVANDIEQRRRAAWLRLSDERDLWLRRVYDSWRDGWRAGFEAGDAAGTRRTQREWHVTAIGLPLSVLGPSWAELERRRYGPGGRAHFGDPRPGDYTGGPVEWDGGQHG